MHGFVPEVISALEKYRLMDYLDRFIGGECSFPDKIPWTRIVDQAIRRVESNQYNLRMRQDPEFKRFYQIHPNPFQLSVWWELAGRKPSLAKQCFSLIQLVTLPAVDDDCVDIKLCHLCGRMCIDPLEHVSLFCSGYDTERDDMWDQIINKCPVTFSTYLHNLEDQDFLCHMLGAPVEQSTSQEPFYDQFLETAMEYLLKIKDTVMQF
jgi:hypothetical protein